MAKQAKSKGAGKKAAAKAPARKPTVKATPSKYDQPGAPWWKKFRPSPRGVST